MKIFRPMSKPSHLPIQWRLAMFTTQDLDEAPADSRNA